MSSHAMTLTELQEEAQRLMGERRFPEAEEALLKILDQDAGRADVLGQLAVIALDRGAFLEAEDRCRRATELDPADAGTWNNLATVKAALGDLKAAVELWKRALAFQPEGAVVHGNLGRALAQLGQPEEAAQHLQRAVSSNPQDWTSRLALASLWMQSGKDLEAADLLSRHTGPEPEIWLTLGDLQARRGRWSEAELAYLAALRTAPHHPDGHTGLAALYLSAGSPGEALDAVERVLFAHPEHAKAHAILGGALSALGRTEEAVDALATSVNRDLGNGHLHHRFLTLLRRDPRQTEATLAEAHTRWGRLVASVVGSRPALPPQEPRDPARTLRVGYLSSDFLHSPGSHVLGAFLLAHDPAQVQVHGYSDVPLPDETTRALAARCHRFRNLAGLSDAQAAELIRQDGLDILVDLAGHIPGGRPGLLAHGVAPLQVAGPGYDCTRGLASLSHRITDLFMDPLGAEAHGPESLLRLERPALAWIPFPEAPAPGPLPAATAGFLTFGYFGTLDRLNDQVLRAWSQLLSQVPGARLSLPPLPQEPRTRALWLDRFEQAGLDLDRLGFRAPAESLAQHFAAFQAVDVALAEFPQPAPASLLEALWMGLPVLGMERRTQAFRPGLGVLGPLGLEGWMPASAEALVATARMLAMDLDGLAALRAGLRARLQASPLLDGPGLARALEGAYRALWASALS